jgi:hypothetical protein
MGISNRSLGEEDDGLFALDLAVLMPRMRPCFWLYMLITLTTIKQATYRIYSYIQGLWLQTRQSASGLKIAFLTKAPFGLLQLCHETSSNRKYSGKTTTLLESSKIHPLRMKFVDKRA